MTKEEFSKYERARILGARALQISMDAPLLLKMKEDEMDNLNFDPLKLAEKELDSGILPISVNRPMPEKKEEKLKEIKLKEVSDKQKDELEEKEVKEIAEEGEIMALASPEDEDELESVESFSEEGGEE